MAKTEYIKNYAGSLIGTIVENPGLGRREAYLWASRLVGWYEPKMGPYGATYSVKAGRYLYEGDATSHLLCSGG